MAQNIIVKRLKPPNVIRTHAHGIKNHCPYR